MKRTWVHSGPALAGLPIAIHATEVLVSVFWSPALFERSNYRVVEVVVLAILLAGAARGLAQRLPLWSYSWIILSLDGAGGLAHAIITGSGVWEFETVRAMGMASLWTSLAASFAVVVAASLLGFRGVRFAMFAILLSLVYGVLGFPVLTRWPFVSAATATVVTSVFGLLAAAEAALAVLFVARFLSAQGKAQIRFLYLLAAIVFVDPLLNGWAFGLNVSRESFSNMALAAVTTIGGTWVITGITLLLVWLLSNVLVRVRAPKPSDGPAVMPGDQV